MRQCLQVDPWLLVEKRELCDVLIPVLREMKRRKEHPYYQYVPDSDEKRNQLAFHRSKARTRLLFGGNQSGKSRAAAQEVAWLLTGEHPYTPVPKECRVYVVSASYRTIQEGIWKHLKRLLPEWKTQAIGPGIPGGWNIPAWIEMRNGHRVDFLSGEGREDARRKAQAAEIDVVVVDEEVDVALWEELQIRLMARGGRAIVAATLMRSEPWCIALQDRAELGDPEVNLFRLSTYRARDQGHVNAESVKEIELSFTADEVEVRLEGKSRSHQGLVYPEFTDKNIVDDFEVPVEWARYAAIDPGWVTCAVLWAAVAPDGKVYIYRERWWQGAHYSGVLDEIFAAEGYRRYERDVPISEEFPHLGMKKEPIWVFNEGETEEIQLHWIDPAGFGHHETGERKIGHLFAEQGLVCAPARNEVEVGIELVRRAFMAGMDGIPKLRIFRSCMKLMKELRSYRRRRDTSGAQQDARPAKPLGKNDHFCDTLRYLILGGCDPVPFNHERRIYEKRLRDLERLEVQTGMDERWRRERIRSLRQDQLGREDRVEHPGGLGTEY